ncbi:meiosis inhibitor protein 1-like [Gigantopelta aegis]|uniref:meiosis inhibitor protein 1-like n=1 Tax=Gigantopelta aegis TaxID=1735272 RepID=UPI001B88740F|nr:meiosis inhibitor protein 1-like [Gigantopelta aegis]
MEEFPPSFLSVKHDDHDESWCFVSVSQKTVVCVACLIDQMDNRDLSVVQRKLTLAVFTGVLREVPDITALFKSRPPLGSYVVNLLINMFQEKEVFIEPAVEACYTLLQSVQSDSLMRHVLNNFQEQLQWVPNVNQIKPFMLLVGQLAATSEAFGARLLKHHESILLELTSMKTSDADFQSGVMFVLVQLFFSSGQPHVSTALKRRVCTLVITTLNEAKVLDLQINLLALLKKLVRDPECSVLLMELTPKKQSLVLALKKVFLTKQEVLQTAAAQSIFGLLTSADTDVFVRQLLDSDLIEFFFEALHTQNGMQLESLFNVLHALTNFEPFFSRCHAVYGVESVLMAIGILMKIKNFNVLEKAFVLLDSMLVRQPLSIPLFVNNASAMHCLSKVDQGLHCNHLPVFVQVLSCTNHLFREEYLPRPYPYFIIVNMLKNAMCKLNDLIQAPSQEIIDLYSTIVSAAARFCQPKLVSSSKDRQSKESASEVDTDIAEIKNILLEIAEEHLLPWICKVWSETDTTHKEVVQSFNSLYDMDTSIMADFSIRVAGSGLAVKVIVLKEWTRDDIRKIKPILDEFLINVFSQLVEQDILMYTKLPDWFQHGLNNLKLSDWEVGDLLAVTDLEASQVLITVLYFSYIYGFAEWSVEDLQHIIISFLAGCVDFSSLPLLCVKHCLFLCAWAQSNNNVTDLLYESEAFRSLLLMLSSCSLEAWYTHHPIMFMWSFSNTLLSDTWGDKLLECWLPTIDMSSLDNSRTHDPDVDLLGSLLYCENFLNTLLKIVSQAKEQLSNTATHIGKWIISKLETQPGDAQDPGVVLHWLYEQSSKQLNDLFLQQTETEEYQLVNMLSLITCLMTDQYKKDEIDNWNVKSVYHVVKHVGSLSSIDSPSLYQSLLYLAKFSDLSEPDYKKVIPVMTQNIDFMRMLNLCLTSHDSALVNVVSRFIAWMSTYPREISTSCPIQVSSEFLLKLLTNINDTSELTLGLLSLISAALSPDSRGSGPLVFTKHSVLEDTPFFTPRDARLIYIHLQQLVCQDDTRVRKLAVRCVERLLVYADVVHGDLGIQLLSHPWNKLWVETLLQFDSDGGLSTETAKLVIAMCSKPEGEGVISQICDVFLRSLSHSSLTHKCASLVKQAHLLDKPFFMESAQPELIAAAKQNLRRLLSSGILVVQEPS